MKMDKFKDPINHKVVDENIKMEGPDEIVTNIAKKLILRRRITLLRFFICVPRSYGAG